MGDMVIGLAYQILGFQLQLLHDGGDGLGAEVAFDFVFHFEFLGIPLMGAFIFDNRCNIIDNQHLCPYNTWNIQ